MTIRLKEIASARSGDKGSNANIGVLAHTPEAYDYLKTFLTSGRVHEYFKGIKPKNTERYELPKLHAFNFVLAEALAGGGSRSLRIDAQGKALGQALLLMELPLSPEELDALRKQS